MIRPIGSSQTQVKLWDAEGNASTPYLQFHPSDSTNWQDATLAYLDGAPYNSSTRVTALPTGTNYVIVWNASADIGANVVTNVSLRARAQDVTLLGNWSPAVEFQLDTTVVTNVNLQMTGITPIQGGIQINWQSGGDAWLYLQRSPAVAGTNAAWMNIWTGTPPTSFSGSYTDSFGTNRTMFYRIHAAH